MLPPSPTVLIFVACVALSGCWSPDPPLLSTSLPGGYVFRSNGGSYGYVIAPGGGRLAQWFGIVDDGHEYWCSDFGWSASMVVCRYEQELHQGSRNAGFFVLDTSTGQATTMPDASGVLALLHAHGVDAMPQLARRHWFHTKLE